MLQAKPKRFDCLGVAFVIPQQIAKREGGLGKVGLIAQQQAQLPFSGLGITGIEGLERLRTVGRAVEIDNNPNLLIPNHPDRPDYDKCITISTDASLREMVAPGALVMLSPIVVGVLLGRLRGVLASTGGRLRWHDLGGRMSYTLGGGIA